MNKVFKLNVSSQCNGCGACFTYQKILKEDAAGKAEVLGDGLFTEELNQEVNEVANICPIKAITTEEVVDIEGKKKELREKIEYLCSYQVPTPTYNDVDFDDTSTTFETSCRFRSGNEYSSESRAQSAGLSELDHGVIRRLESSGRHNMHDYKQQVLNRILSFEANDKNWAYNAIQAVQKELQGLANDIEALMDKKQSISPSTFKIESEPDFGRKNSISYLYDLEEIADSYLPKEMMANVESASWYDVYINTDERVVDLKGHTKACFELTEAILKVNEHYFAHAKDAVKEYVSERLKRDRFEKVYEPIEREVREKANALLKYL